MNRRYPLGAASLAAGLCMTIGTAAAQTFTTLHSFSGGDDGGRPSSYLTQCLGGLYGTTNGAEYTWSVGTVFRIDPSTGAETVLHSFTGITSTGVDGSYPEAGLTCKGGILYGASTRGGLNNVGTVYEVNAATGSESVLYSFGANAVGYSPQSNLLDLGGILIGTADFGEGAAGTVFKVDAVSGAAQLLYGFGVVPDGNFPLGGVISRGGYLYGTTSYGGARDHGAVYRIDRKTGAETVLYSFTGGVDGGSPADRLIERDGYLYGATTMGGSKRHGTVFKINLATGVETVVHSFAGGKYDGANPVGGLTDHDGILYGITSAGGASNAGTVFKLDRVANTGTLLYSFTGGADGGTPVGGVTIVGNSLYGMTQAGGAYNYGTVYRLGL